MSTLTVTAKGQVTRRKDVLHHLGVRPGEKIVVDKLPDGRIEVRAAGDISAVFGMLKRDDGRHLSIEDIDAAIAAAWAGERSGSPPIPMCSSARSPTMTRSKCGWRRASWHVQTRLL